VYVYCVYMMCMYVRMCMHVCKNGVGEDLEESKGGGVRACL
jgi:hypothetical protein